MAVLAGRLVTLKVGGTATTAEDEPCSQVSGTIYQITSEAKRAIDPNTAVEVSDGGTPIDATAYEVDYANGKITLDDTPSGEVTITCKYIPLLTVGLARSANIVEPQAVFADTTGFNDTARRQVELMKMCSLEIEYHDDISTDLDSGGGTTSIQSLLAAGTPFFVECALSTARTLRGWFVATAANRSAPQTDVQSVSITLEGRVQACSGRTEQALFSVA